MILPILWIWDSLQDSHRTVSRKHSKVSAVCSTSLLTIRTLTIFKWCTMLHRPLLNSTDSHEMVAGYLISRPELRNKDKLCLHQEPTKCRDNCNKWKGFALLVNLRSSTWGRLSPGRVRHLTRIGTRFTKDCLAVFVQLRLQHLKNLALLSVQAEYRLK